MGFEKEDEVRVAQREPSAAKRKAWSRPVVILAAAEETEVKGTRIGDYSASVIPVGS